MPNNPTHKVPDVPKQPTNAPPTKSLEKRVESLENKIALLEKYNPHLLVDETLLTSPAPEMAPGLREKETTTVFSPPVGNVKVPVVHPQTSEGEVLETKQDVLDHAKEHPELQPKHQV